MSVRRSFWIGLAVLMLVVGLSSGSWAEPGVTDKEIKLGAIMDLSGPIAFMGKGIAGGQSTYYKYINDQGGVHGRKINLIVEDDGYSPPKSVAAAKKLIESDQVFCISFVLGSAQALAMYPILERTGVPLVHTGTQNSRIGTPPKKYLFLADPSYLDQAKIQINFALKDLNMEKPKVGVVYQDDEPGQDYYKGVVEACKHYGLELVAEAPFKRGTVDFSSHVAKLKSAGADLVMTWLLVREPAALLKEAEKVAYKPVWFTASGSADPMILKLAGDSAFYGNGFFAAGILAYPFKDNPAAAEMMAVWPKYNDRPWSFYDYYSWGAAKIMVEALKRTGKEPTREGLIKALESFNGFETGIFGPLTWGPNKRAGNQFIQIQSAVKLPGGNHKYFPISAWVKADF
ncbi:MAG: ABC transporter substrate-binding protein [Proteobacteria bacterium]|nr:ABC transporter substrate-binding protein [Pseudomonadota bacterium]